MTAHKTYICGVCKGTFEGSPKGGFNTRSGEVVCCSGECTIKGLTTREDITMLIRLTHTLTRVPFLDSRKCSGEAACGGDRAVRRPLKQETRVVRPSRETHFCVSTG